MNDIDFDELDRAVNSLISGKTRDIQQNDDNKVVASFDTPAISVDEPTPKSVIKTAPDTASSAQPLNTTKPQFSEKKSIPAQKAPSTPTTTKQAIPSSFYQRPRPLVTTPIAPPKPAPVTTFASLASKRSVGRFVDIVNPFGHKKNHSDDVTVESDERPTPIGPESVKSTETSNKASNNEVSTHSKREHYSIDDPDTDIEAISSLIDKAMNLNKPKPEAPRESIPKNDSTVSFDESSYGRKPLKSIENPNNQLPPELQNELLSIESDAVVPMKQSTKISIPPIVADTSMSEESPLQKSPEFVDSNKTKEQTVLEAGKVVSIAPVSLEHPASGLVDKVHHVPSFSTPTSVNQQYQEKQNSTAQESEPFYDNDDYYDGNSIGAKRSALVWFAWIMSLVIIGAGVGVVAFFFVLPNLQ